MSGHRQAHCSICKQDGILMVLYLIKEYVPVLMNIFIAVCHTSSKAGELVTVEFLVLDFVKSFLPVVESSFSFKQHGG